MTSNVEHLALAPVTNNAQLQVRRGSRTNRSFSVHPNLTVNFDRVLTILTFW